VPGQKQQRKLEDVPMMQRLLPYLGLALVVTALLVLQSGCETLTETTLEENHGAYADAREFLAVGHTTRDQVAAKYGKPGKVSPLDKGGEYWEYRRRETVETNAYTQTPLGTEGGMLRNLGGYQHSIQRTTVLEVFFDANGVLAFYRINRGTL
jgi:outer membrane protein assembly factor BamE (lipoprotein component of BamABCDE complex)